MCYLTKLFVTKEKIPKYCCFKSFLVLDKFLGSRIKGIINPFVESRVSMSFLIVYNVFKLCGTRFNCSENSQFFLTVLYVVAISISRQASLVIVGTSRRCIVDWIGSLDILVDMIPSNLMYASQPDFWLHFARDSFNTSGSILCLYTFLHDYVYTTK